jgi:O-antigen biosynthesis protein
VKLLTVDIERPLADIPPATVGEQWVLVRLHGAPLGILQFPRNGCSAAELARTVSERFTTRIRRHLTADRLCAADPFDAAVASEQAFDDIPAGIWRPELVPAVCPQRRDYPRPAVTVAVCTRNGAGRLPECLDALTAIDYPAGRLDLLVVDNAPETDATSRLIGANYPGTRVVIEPRPGLDWARNRAILEARGEILAFTDDDASVDRGWVDAIARVFAEEPEAQCVAGLVVPDAIDVLPHRLFEEYGGFGRGFDRRYYRVNVQGGESAAERHGGTGKFGTGANMAFRRSTFDRIGSFDPALDVGTPTNGGGDLEMFFRVLKAGGLLVYEPAAVVRHRHRNTHAELRTQLANNGVGFYAYLVRTARAYPDERNALLRLGVSWYCRWNLWRLARTLTHPNAFPRDLVVAEARGAIAGLGRYTRAQQLAQHVRDTYGPQSPAVS